MKLRNARFSREWLFVLVALVFSAAVFMFRLNSFGDIEPRADQAFFAWWVQGLEATDHLVPHRDAGEAFFDALARDEKGFLTQLFRPIYNSTTELFKLVPLLVTYGTTLILGGAYTVQVAVGIWASVAVLFVICLFPYWRGRSTAGERGFADGFLVGGIALVLGAASLYLHLFSALGVHNFGILFLTIGVAVSGRVLAGVLTKPHHRMPWRSISILFLVNGLALYSYKTNVFVLPVATGLFILAFPGVVLRRKLQVLLAYGGLCVVLVSPIFLFFAVDAAKPDFAKDSFSLSAILASQVPGGLAESLKIVGLRAGAWFRTGAELFSWPGLVAGLWGLGRMASHPKLSLPLWTAFAHFLAWCLIPLFAGTGLRTFPYILPFLILGCAYLTVTYGRAIRMVRTGRSGEYAFRVASLAIVVLLVASHLWTQIPGFGSRQRMAAALPEAWEVYMVGQGELRPMVSEIEGILPQEAVLMTWGYGLQYVFRDLKQTETKITIPPAINALILRHRVGLLRDHIQRRHFSLPAGEPVFFLVDQEIEHVDDGVLRNVLAVVLGRGGYGIAETVDLERRGQWDLTTSWPRKIILYAVQINGKWPTPGLAIGEGTTSCISTSLSDRV